MAWSGQFGLMLEGQTLRPENPMEEANAWRHPVDLVAILEQAFGALPAALEQRASRRGGWAGREALVPVLLGEDAQAMADALLGALREGATGEEVAGAVAYAAA